MKTCWSHDTSSTEYHTILFFTKTVDKNNSMPQGQKQIIVVKCNTLKCTVSTRPNESQVFYGPVLGEDSGACGQSESCDNIHGRCTKG